VACRAGVCGRYWGHLGRVSLGLFLHLVKKHRLFLTGLDPVRYAIAVPALHLGQCRDRAGVVEWVTACLWACH